MPAGTDPNEMEDVEQLTASSYPFLSGFPAPMCEQSATTASDSRDFPAPSGAFFPTGSRLQPWQLPSLNVDFDASSSAGFSDSFPSSGTTSTCVSQYTSPLSPTIYSQLWDVNVAPPEVESGFEPGQCATRQQAFDFQWGFSQVQNKFLPDRFVPIHAYTPQAPPILDDGTSMMMGATDFYIPQAVPHRTGRSHSNSLSSICTSFTNMSTPASNSSPAMTTTTPLLQPSLRRTVRSFSNPSLKSSPSPCLLKPSHSQVSLTGSNEVDELMQINEGETMDLVLPPGSVGSSTTNRECDDEFTPVEDTSLYSQGRFIDKIWRLMHHQPTTAAIQWSEDGTDVVIPRAGDLGVQLLPLYFQHNNFSSFVTQLTAYGFTKQKIPLTTDGKRPKEADWRWVFSHPDFQRGRSDLAKKIKRKSSESAAASHSLTRVALDEPVTRLPKRQAKPNATLNPKMQYQQEFATQRAQLNLQILRQRETQAKLASLQVTFNDERGRANRLATLGVTLLSICRASFPGALSELPPYSDEDLMVIHSPGREGFAGAMDFEDGEDEEGSTPPPIQPVIPPSLHIATEQLDGAWQRAGIFTDGVLAHDDPASASSVQPSSGLQTPTFGSFGEALQDQDGLEQTEDTTLQAANANRQSKRQRFDEEQAAPPAQASSFTPARLRSYSASSARLTRSSQTFPRPSRTKRPSQSQLMTSTQD